MAAQGGEVQVRFYEELGEFLPPALRKRSFPAAFHAGDTVKALVEALGVPHTEVDLVLVNGESVPFSHRLRHGERISVYPTFESFDIGPVTRVRPQPLRDPRFVLDVHLGRLAKLLRMLGFDSLYTNHWDDSSLSDIAARERRTVLTRDRGLLMRRSVTHGYLVRSHKPVEQLAEVLRRFDLRGAARPFTRCLRCNTPLEPVPRERAVPRLPEHVARAYRSFKQCPDCGRLYWRGSHWEAMRRLLDTLLQSLML